MMSIIVGILINVILFRVANRQELETIVAQLRMISVVPRLVVQPELPVVMMKRERLMAVVQRPTPHVARTRLAVVHQTLPFVVLQILEVAVS